MRRGGALRHPDRSAPRLGSRFAVGTGHLCQIKFWLMQFKRTYELTSSIVPRGTSFHRSVELECPYWIRCCRVFMLLLLLWPVLGSSGTRCGQPICGA